VRCSKLRPKFVVLVCVVDMRILLIFMSGNILGCLLLCGVLKVEKNCTSELQRIKKEKYFIAVMGKGLRAQCKDGCVLSQLNVNIFLYFYLIDSLVKKLNTSTLKSTLMVCRCSEPAGVRYRLTRKLCL
jgi:hypothetical protein